MRKFIRRTNRILVYIKTANICSTSSLFSSSRLSCFLHGSILPRTLHKKNFKLLEKDKFFCDLYQISLQKRTQKLEKYSSLLRKQQRGRWKISRQGTDAKASQYYWTIYTEHILHRCSCHLKDCKPPSRVRCQKKKKLLAFFRHLNLSMGQNNTPPEGRRI